MDDKNNPWIIDWGLAKSQKELGKKFSQKTIDDLLSLAHMPLSIEAQKPLLAKISKLEEDREGK